ncbi:MAG: RDD family protein, partial [Bdellovibrionales bacterium]|nr:RDD family protein [Bdellovibrionales bacterium]
MVIENPWESKRVPIKPSGPPSSTFFLRWMAHPWDRLAAFFLDLFVVLSPVVMFLVSPFRRKLLEAVLLNNESEFLLMGVFMVVISLFTFWAYEFLAVGIYGTTLGKKFFALKVVNVHTGGKPSIETSLIRASILIIEVLLVFPLFTVFSHPLRRMFHDRVGDTFVMTLKGKPAVPQVWEISIARGLFSA